MQSDELVIIQKDVNDFLLTNKEKYDAFSGFQHLILNIDNNSIQQIIDYVECHKNIFFKNHSNAILFFYTIIILSKCIFKKLEQILSICVHFSNYFKNDPINATEIELLDISKIYPNSINYLFSKNFFSIKTIFDASTTDELIFDTFYPEIEQYDQEFAHKMKNTYSSTIGLLIQKIPSSYIRNIVSDYQKHILNRNLNYHPSPLHKSIREDDIDTFQKLLSQNNINFNDPIDFSFYERSKTFDEKMTPIKIAALYGSIKVFKFLLMNNAIVDDNILCYAYFGNNIEIIHLIENQNPNEKVYTQPISNYHNELLDYLFDNFNVEIEESNKQVKKLLENYIIEENEEEKNNQYNALNYNCLKVSTFSYNYSIITSCLEKIVFIVKNYELIERQEKDCDDDSIFSASCFDIDLFKFFFSQMKQSVDIHKCGLLFSFLRTSGSFVANDSFKFLIIKLKDDINIIYYLNWFVKNNHELANFILDSLFDNLKDIIDYSFVDFILDNYNENILVKVIQLYEPIKSMEILSVFAQKLLKNLSTNMLISLFTQLCKVLKYDFLIFIAETFKNNEKKLVYEFIMNNLPK